MNKTPFRYLCLFSVLLLTACAEPRLGKNLVVVLPDPNGKVGAVNVDDGKNKVLLDKAFAAAKVTTSGAVESVGVTKKDVDDIFKKTIAALPIIPKRFRLYFKGDSAALKDDSRQAFEDVFNDIARRSAFEVEVTGHTDRVGTTAYNEKLSLRRAKAIRDTLVKRGVKPDLIQTYGRGEWDLLVPTPDNKHEPRNRRVEIMVR